MDSTIATDEDDYSKYSAFDETISTMENTTSSFAAIQQSNQAAAAAAEAGEGEGGGKGGLRSLVKNVNLRNSNKLHRAGKHRKQQQRVYSRDEFLYALSSPSSIGAMAWMISSLVSVIFGSSVVVLINFCIPLLVGPFVINEQMAAQLAPCKLVRSFHETENQLCNFFMSSQSSCYRPLIFHRSS